MSPFVFRKTAVSQQKRDLATRLLPCVGVRLKLLKCHWENGNFLTKPFFTLSSAHRGKNASKWIQSRTCKQTETPTNTVCRWPFVVFFLSPRLSWSACSCSGQWSYLFVFFLFCVNIFILMWSEPLDCKCVQARVECTSDRNVSERNYGWKPFLYT